MIEDQNNITMHWYGFQTSFIIVYLHWMCLVWLLLRPDGLQRVSLNIIKPTTQPSPTTISQSTRCQYDLYQNNLDGCDFCDHIWSEQCWWLGSVGIQSNIINNENVIAYKYISTINH